MRLRANVAVHRAAVNDIEFVCRAVRGTMYYSFLR